MEYEWDEEKNEANKTKHGIDFAELPEFLSGPGVSFTYDPAHSTFREDRFHAEGLHTKYGFILVVITEIVENLTRIISARRKE
jgi:uncharacterized DUF497 family protein